MSDKCLICGLVHDMKNTMGLPDLEACIQTLQADNGRLRQESFRDSELIELLRKDRDELREQVKLLEADVKRLSGGTA